MMIGNTQILIRLRTLMVRSGDLAHINADPSQGVSNGDLLKQLRSLDEDSEGEEGEIDEAEGSGE
ncbi:hypothetical protein LCGC14_2489040 [marine sediment metagenome]|uniref:Uncharacterized protein n=1 Tax=marine sediment metagenome TaxID=412755 RepID=A0A0F9B5D6_9ZZZZ